MIKSEIFQKVTNVFEEVLNVIEIELETSTTADDLKEWDSLTHIQIITEIELQFDIRFSTREIEQFKNIGDMVSLIESKKP